MTLQRRIINPDGVARPIGTYSHVARVRPGELLYIAGQVGVDKDGNLAGDDVASQVRQVFENIKQILASQGATFSNVVEFTVYLVGRDAVQPYMSARTEVFNKELPNGDYPPSTLLIVNGLAREQFRVEVKAVAALP
ncbi:MAG: RidA family protein [Chloroflexi bacterium]|nr:RidA family protein [Chloroflexota bacterium]